MSNDIPQIYCNYPYSLPPWLQKWHTPPLERMCFRLLETYCRLIHPGTRNRGEDRPSPITNLAPRPGDPVNPWYRAVPSPLGARLNWGVGMG